MNLMSDDPAIWRSLLPEGEESLLTAPVPSPDPPDISMTEKLRKLMRRRKTDEPIH
jgi:hypothetical protein